MRLTISSQHRKKVAVISHERSGTHFLMNTIGSNFEYISAPWWNFDINESINFHAPYGIRQYFQTVDDKCVLNILKSHHPVGFFQEIIDYLTDQFHVFYIYRDPRDVLVSNWKLINTFSWDEGPKTDTASRFIRAEPCGAMLRYQKKQERNMLQRWRTHVEGWLDLVDGNPDYGVLALSYEELNLDFESTLNKISDQLELPYETPKRPDVGEKVIGTGGVGLVSGYRQYLDDEDLEFVYSEVGDLMDRLAYPR